jgi:hypothetical protein
MLVSAEIRWFWHDAAVPGIESWFCAGPYRPGGGPPPRVDEYLWDPGQVELGLKKRGEKPGIEVKGLIATVGQTVQIGSINGHIQVWTKWTSESLRLDSMAVVKTYKVRLLRKFDIVGGSFRELPLDKFEKLVNKNEDLPVEGCNVELTTVSLKENGPKWWTLGFEAFGTLNSVEQNLRKTVAHFVGSSLPDLQGGAEQSYPAWLSARLSANS